MLTTWKSVSTGIPVNIRKSYAFSRSRTKFIIWLRILPGATDIRLSSEILPEHSMGVLCLQWSLRYRETLTFHWLSRALDNLNFKSRFCWSRSGDFFVFIFVQDLCHSRQTKDSNLDFPHVPSQVLLLKISNLCEKENSGKRTTGQCWLHRNEGNSLGAPGYFVLVRKYTNFLF